MFTIYSINSTSLFYRSKKRKKMSNFTWEFLNFWFSQVVEGKHG